jgi:hypothetical protein
MALRSTQSLTEKSTRNLPGVKGRLVFAAERGGALCLLCDELITKFRRSKAQHAYTIISVTTVRYVSKRRPEANKQQYTFAQHFDIRLNPKHFSLSGSYPFSAEWTKRGQILWLAAGLTLTLPTASRQTSMETRTSCSIHLNLIQQLLYSKAAPQRPQSLNKILTTSNQSNVFVEGASPQTFR